MNQQAGGRDDAGGNRARLSRDERLVAALTGAVLVTGAITYVVDSLALWIGWWLGTVAVVGWVMIRLNR